jgi:TetR/AcrR family transcriptional repressor of nem operon
MFFRRCLERGQRTGEIGPKLDPDDTAHHLLGIVLGIRVAARSRPERALLEGMVRPAIALLDHPMH